jgi:hypothetical protein
MLEKTKREVEQKGDKTAVKQIERAQQEVVEHINSIDSTALNRSKKKLSNNDILFGNTDLSIFDFDKEEKPKSVEKVEEKELDPVLVEENNDMIVPSNTVVSDETTFNNIDSSTQYDVIQLPSNGQCYKNKVDRVPVAYLTAYDENIITSPNLYKDGLVIDFLLKNKIVNNAINPDDLVSGDADAIILFLRATSYGPEFPIIVSDPDTGEQIESVVDLTTLKPKEFTLIGDENGWFDFETPIKKDKIKFKYLSRKEEKRLQKINEIESYGTKAFMLNTERETLLSAMLNDTVITENEKKTIRSAVKVMTDWAKRLNEKNQSEYNRIVTNTMMLQVMSINGNTDKEYIAKYIKTMPARDALMLRRYIDKNKPGIDFDIEVERPESLGGGSFKTFLNWDDSVFLNISDV